MIHVLISSVFAGANISDDPHDPDVFQKEAEIVANLEFATDRFWPCSGRFEVVVLYGMLGLVAQFVYWSRIVSGLNQEHARRSSDARLF